MRAAQVQFTEEELLADLHVAEPLVAGGVRCHGGFDERRAPTSRPGRDSGSRPSRPGGRRTASDFATQLIDVPTGELASARFPASSRRSFLIRVGVPGPLIGHADADRHGRGIRSEHPSPQARRDLQRPSSRTCADTAIDHIGPEGCSRPTVATRRAADEEAGHRDMWFAAPRHRASSTGAIKSSTWAPCSSGWVSAPGAMGADGRSRCCPDDVCARRSR